MPILVHIFDVSTDELLEVDIEKQKLNIDTAIKFAQEEYTYNARWKEAVDYLSDVLKKYPSSHMLMYELSVTIVNYHSRNDIRDYEEVYYLCNKVLSQSMDSALRYKTLRILATAYGYAGDKGNLSRTVEQMPFSCDSKEAFMLWRNADCEGSKHNQEYLSFLISEAVQVINVLSLCNCRFSDDERINILMQNVSLLDTMFPEGDYQKFAQLADGACAKLARIYYSRGEVDRFFHWLNRHVEFSIIMDTYDPNGIHTSPLFAGMEFGGWIKEEGMSRSEQNLEIWKNKIYDDVRSDPRFVSAMERLKSVK